MSKANEPAFPHSKRNWTGDDKNGQYESIADGGLTKREYFAAMAMQGVIQNPAAGYGPADKRAGAIIIAEAAVMMADALIAELEKTK